MARSKISNTAFAACCWASMCLSWGTLRPWSLGLRPGLWVVLQTMGPLLVLCLLAPDIQGYQNGTITLTLGTIPTGFGGWGLG